MTTINQRVSIDWDFEDFSSKPDPRKSKQMPYSVLEAMSYTISYIDNLADTETIDLSRLIMELETGKPERWLRDNTNAAKDMLEFWGFEMMQARMAGNGLTKWQKTVAKLVSNYHSTIIQDDLRVIVTLPRFTELQKRYHGYAEKYKSIRKGSDFYNGQLTFVENYMHANSRKTAEVYVFKNDINELFLYELDSRRDWEKRMFLDTIISDRAGVLNVNTRVRPRQLTAHLLAHKIMLIEKI